MFVTVSEKVGRFRLSGLSETTTEDTEIHGKDGFGAQGSVPGGVPRFQSTIQLERLRFFRDFRGVDR